MALAVLSEANEVPVTVSKPVPKYLGTAKIRSVNGILKRLIWMMEQIPEAKMRMSASIRLPVHCACAYRSETLQPYLPGTGSSVVLAGIRSSTSRGTHNWHTVSH